MPRLGVPSTAMARVADPPPLAAGRLPYIIDLAAILPVAANPFLLRKRDERKARQGLIPPGRRAACAPKIGFCRFRPLIPLYKRAGAHFRKINHNWFELAAISVGVTRPDVRTRRGCVNVLAVIIIVPPRRTIRRHRPVLCAARAPSGGLHAGARRAAVSAWPAGVLARSR